MSATEAKPPMTAPGVGVVTAQEPELLAQAQRFAAAHGRRCVEWPSGTTADAFVEGVGGGASLTVFVSARRMTHELLHGLIQLSVRRGLPLGLVPCTPRSQVPLAPPSPSAEALPRRSPLFSYFYPGHEVPGVHDTYGRPAWEAFLEQAERGAEAMVVHTHSNGADAPFGEAVICARVDGRPSTGELVRCLPCHADGPCIREQNRDFRWYFGPSYLRCHALILLSCTGFPPADSLLQYEGSLAHAALAGGTIRSIVTSIRIANSSTLPLALSAKRFVEEGGAMGHLALAINQADTASLPHYICIGDPEYRPIQGPLELGPARETPAPPTPDVFRGQKALVALAEAELLARVEPPPWSAIDARMSAVLATAGTPAHVPMDEPPRLVGEALEALERLAERLDEPGRCSSCQGATERYRWRPVMAREDLRLERCPTHGITAVDADMVVDLGETPADRAARWLFTALTLRQITGQLDARADEALDVARTLEGRALVGDVATPASRELDQQIASLFGASVAAGGEAFLTRQLRYVSTSKHGTVDHAHACGQRLLYVDLSPIPLRVRRRVWFCPLCGVVGNTLRELALPEVTAEAGRWRATPVRAPFAADGCALVLVWETRGLRRDEWSTSTWLHEPSEGELQQRTHGEFAGLRALAAIMVADAEVSTVRVPVLLSSPGRRQYSLRQLNDREYPAT